MKKTEVRKYKIDAKAKTLGSVATESAHLLMGKATADFARNLIAPVEVYIENADLMNIDLSKLKKKEYKSYSGYPGGLKKETMENVIAKKGYGEVLRRAVRGMLPSNRLRDELMKKLFVAESK